MGWLEEEIDRKSDWEDWGVGKEMGDSKSTLHCQGQPFECLWFKWVVVSDPKCHWDYRKCMVQSKQQG